jgi:hypothetical protein
MKDLSISRDSKLKTLRDLNKLSELSLVQTPTRA